MIILVYFSLCHANPRLILLWPCYCAWRHDTFLGNFSLQRTPLSFKRSQYFLALVFSRMNYSPIIRPRPRISFIKGFFNILKQHPAACNCLRPVGVQFQDSPFFYPVCIIVNFNRICIHLDKFFQCTEMSLPRAGPHRSGENEFDLPPEQYLLLDQ